MADRKITQMTPALAGDVTDADQLLIADVSASPGDLGSKSLSMLEAKRALAMGTAALATEQSLDGLQQQIDALSSGMLIVGAWDAGSGAFPATRPDGTPVHAGDAWIVTGTGTVDGEPFAVADRLVALTDGGGATYPGHWLRSPHADDQRYDFASKAALVAAAIPAEVLVARVVRSGMVLTYARDTGGATELVDGSHWRLVSGAHYASVLAALSDSYPYDAGDAVTAGLTVAAIHGYAVVASDPDVTTAGGVGLRVQPDQQGWYHLDAFGAAGDGSTDDSARLTKAISRGKVQLGARMYAVAGIQPVSNMHIRGRARNTTWRTSGLVCTVAGGAIFSDPTSAPIYSVTLEDFHADCTATGCRFYDSASQVKYSGGFRFVNLVASCNFLLLFRFCPIYLLIDDCLFGQTGNRLGGSQEFRIMEAWSDSNASLVNHNQVRNTRHYNVHGATTAVAAYTLRHGAKWRFENCSMEQFTNGYVADAAAFMALNWEGGWIEAINAPQVFRTRIDAAAPSNIAGGPIRIAGSQIDILNSTCEYLIVNGNGTVDVQDINIRGNGPEFRLASQPSQIAFARNIYAPAAPLLQQYMQERGAIYQGRLTPWRNGIVPASLSVSSTGVAPTLSGATSAYTGEASARIAAGDGAQVIYRQVPTELLQSINDGRAVVALVGRWEAAAAFYARACYWVNVTPTHANVTASAANADAIGASYGTNVGVSSCPVFIPATLTSFHVGFVLNGGDVGKFFALEGLHLLASDQKPTLPFFV
ncbi:hypothetical protein CDV50_10190 [Haematobacter massiliensis]|uniref:hypothetical protein n=1 Tax=Haematobacter massiliensis TaxID=195105 RepID=UPI000B49F5DF|nr:hypothetical protein [Haematobacter massiliensis]OWJ71366.1 hypothetical protein CDV50_10190 [Haematobacter massiliensis]